MIIYWLLFAYFAVGALVTPLGPDVSLRRRNAAYVFGFVVFAILIGLRYRVGADWESYDLIYAFAGRSTLWSALSIGDPGYQVVNWMVFHSDGSIWVVNLVCGSIFSWGLYRFCRVQPDPWLAVLVAVPYMVIVVAMGYTRQSVGLGVLLAGLAAIQRGTSTIRFAAYVAVAALFHKTAVIAFPLVALTSTRNRLLNFLLVIAVSISLYDLFLGDAMDDFIQHYIRTRYSSQGAAVRIAMTMVAAITFWIARRRLQLGYGEWKLWRNFSAASVGMLLLLLVLPSSTAVDRMSLYLLPLQLAILSRLPLAFGSQFTGKVAVVAYSALVQFVWLNFAQHAQFWVPYRFFPI